MSNILNLDAKSALTYVTTLHHLKINQKIVEGKYFPVEIFPNFSKVADQLFRRKQSTKFGVFSKCQSPGDITLRNFMFSNSVGFLKAERGISGTP